MKNLLNIFLMALMACALTACSGMKSSTDNTTVETNPVTGPDASNPNTQSSPTGLTSGGSQISVDTAAAVFPVDEKGELSTESFIQLAALAGTKEIELGKLAAQKGQSEAVRNFGSMMVTDHTKADKDLRALAGTKNITITLKSDTLRPEQDYKLAAKQLNLLEPDKFDRAYLVTMLEDHKRAVALFQLGAASKDTTVRAYAERYLPKLRDHLAQVEELTK
jgi:putative membrane protein